MRSMATARASGTARRASNSPAARALARAGKGVIVISSELPEVMGLADRVLVMRQGRLAGEVSGKAITEENIVRLAMGLGREAEPA